MFIAMGLMLLGMILGWLLRGRAWLGLLTRCVSPAIMLLLFSLGVAVGGNRELMNNLPLLGGKALAVQRGGVAVAVGEHLIDQLGRFLPGPGGGAVVVVNFPRQKNTLPFILKNNCPCRSWPSPFR